MIMNTLNRVGGIRVAATAGAVVVIEIKEQKMTMIRKSWRVKVSSDEEDYGIART